MGKKYYFEVWGCQMNEADVMMASRRLNYAGFFRTTDIEEADIIFLETCCVRDKPEHKIYSRLGELKALREKKTDLLIGVLGCMAEKEGAEIIKKAVLKVNMVVAPRRLSELPEIVSACYKTGESQVALGVDGDITETPQAYCNFEEDKSLKAFVNIIEGCNYCCTYCIVPSVRGRFTSRKPMDIADEVKYLVQCGVKEVTLLGQSVLAYGRDKKREFNIVNLFEILNNIEGLERIRFTTNHPIEVTDEIIYAVRDMPKIMEHFHMPLQAGNDWLLKEMRRAYTVEKYENLLCKMRDIIPNISVTGDIIVGFPGETEEMFLECVETYSRLKLDQQFIFAFSPRPGTPAATMNGQIAHKTKIKRLSQVVELQNDISVKINEKQIGATFEVMAEGPSKTDKNKWSGRTRNDKMVIFDVFDNITHPGDIISVKTDTAHMWGFSGKILK